MNIATALRDLLAHVESADVHATKAGGVGPFSYGRTEYAQVAAARAALAAHDAAVSAGEWNAVTATNGMPMAQHPRMTSEWHNGGFVYAMFPGPDGIAWQERAVACVNACQGIADPVAYVTETRAIVESLRARIDADNAMTPQAIMVRRAHDAIAGGAA